MKQIELRSGNDGAHTLLHVHQPRWRENRSSPLAAHPEPGQGVIYFLADADSAKDEEVEAHFHVNLTFAGAGAHSYVSVTGRARVANDGAGRVRAMLRMAAAAVRSSRPDMATTPRSRWRALPPRVPAAPSA